MTVRTNAERAESARSVLQSAANRMYGAGHDRNISKPESFDQAMADLMCNFMHLVDEMADRTEGTDEQTSGEDWWEIIQFRATGYHDEEVREEYQSDGGLGSNVRELPRGCHPGDPGGDQGTDPARRVPDRRVGGVPGDGP